MRSTCILVSILVVLLATPFVEAQRKDRQMIFAHNDYLKPNPFHAAYAERVGFIEVDIFLKDNNLLVAHTRAEITPDHNIEDMYLDPLKKMVSANGGNAYANVANSLHLMVDIKTEAVPTLRRLVDVLSGYPELTSCKNLFITISGNMPSPAEWAWVPMFIHFDGRPGISYDQEQLQRVPLISSGFRSYSSWNGKRKLTSGDRARLMEAIMAIHLLGKPVRFWATPDNPSAWAELSALGVDIINTDDVAAAIQFVEH
jgi:alkaline phosphatase